MPLHPSIVHFPPVLLLTAGVLYWIGIVGRRPQLEVVGFCLHAAGLVAAVAAIFTGDFEADRLSLAPALAAAVERHETWVTFATYGFGLLGIWAFARQNTRHRAEKVAFAAAFTVLLIGIAFGAHLGGTMVYEKGIGVAPMEESLRPAADSGAVAP